MLKASVMTTVKGLLKFSRATRAISSLEMGCSKHLPRARGEVMSQVTKSQKDSPDEKACQMRRQGADGSTGAALWCGQDAKIISQTLMKK